MPLPVCVRFASSGARLAHLLAAGLLGILGGGAVANEASPDEGLFSTQAAEAAEVAASAPVESVKSASKAPVYRSDLDGPLIYQLLVGEISARQGDPGTAYQLYLDAARRTRNEDLFRRAVDIAVRAQAGEQALAAARAWRGSLPASRSANEYTAQILLAMNRPAEAVEPLRAIIAAMPVAERPRMIASVPATLSRLSDRKLAATLVDQVVEPFRADPLTAAGSIAASGRARFASGDLDAAMSAVTSAFEADPDNESAALLAVELSASRPEVEPLIRRYLDRSGALHSVRLSWARRLAESSRMAEAAVQLDAVTRASPDFAGAWLSLGAARLDLRELDAAEAALKRYLQLRQPPPSPGSASPPAAAREQQDSAAAPDPEAAEPTDGPINLLISAASDEQQTQAYLLLAQLEEERGQYAAGQAWLDKIAGDSNRMLSVQIRRASLLARQGRIDQARRTIREAPAASDTEVRGKLVAEALLLRDADRWKESGAVFAEALTRFPDDTDLLYQSAMVSEKLGAYDQMEQQLRRVIAIDPAYHNAYNALGFSLADRNVRLLEARQLIQRALELAPGDPFIVDSLGWVEFRLGNLPEARRLLLQAYQARPNTEIGAHLGEVLWMLGERDEARRIWREAKRRDATNSTLQATLKRLKPGI